MNLECRRDKIIKTIPISYHDTLHAFIPTFVGLAVIIISLLTICQFSFWMVPLVILTLFSCFGFEWYVHKHVLHMPWKWLESIHVKHMAHHILYTNADMTMRDRKELYFILMPSYAIFVILILVTPIVAGLALTFGPDIARIVLATLSGFFLTYEWLHYAYHHPPNTFISNLKLIKILRNHHLKHHNPRKMQHYNFNVTLPVFDWIMKTKI